MKVLNAGAIELVDYMGSDLSVVQAARISNGAAMPDWRGTPDERLIEFLANHEHMTPFEHASFKFYVKAPIFVIREWQRHRTFSYNELSGRYKKLAPEFYYPDRAREPDPNNKQGSRVPDSTCRQGELDSLVKKGLGEAYQKSYAYYEEMLKGGIAREIARSVMPLGMYTEMYVSGNFRNWMHFYHLRNSDEAQYEIRVYADALGLYLQDKMPLSFDALHKA